MIAGWCIMMYCARPDLQEIWEMQDFTMWVYTGHPVPFHFAGS
jgi:hypothetical protein